MTGWGDIIDAIARAEGPAALITVGKVKGSTPRETGATMLVSEKGGVGTIGGGRLEYLAQEKARMLFSGTSDETDIILKVPLGPELAQCCGGYAEIHISLLDKNDIYAFNRLNNKNADHALLSHWTGSGCQRQIVNIKDLPTYLDPALQAAVDRQSSEKYSEIVTHGTGTDFTLVQSLQDHLFDVSVFGAGHVGKAVVNILSTLSCHINWIDGRTDMFPDTIPTNVKKIVSADPASEAGRLSATGYFLVMTHSHQLDLEICDSILRKENLSYLGLIGSETKRAKFWKRLNVRGLTSSQIDQLTCPIGVSGLNGKRPAEIAISVAADILARYQHRKTIQSGQQSKGAYGPQM